MTKPTIAFMCLLAVCTQVFACPRSTAAKHEFMRTHACPATVAHKKYSCPGFVVDHRIALACGGADSPSNMQYQTVADAKAKDKWERKGCATRKVPPTTKGE